MQKGRCDTTNLDKDGGLVAGLLRDQRPGDIPSWSGVIKEVVAFICRQ